MNPVDNSPAENMRDAFPFIQKILATAFRADTMYFSYPYQDIRKIDWGFRDMVWADINFTPDFAAEGTSSHQFHMYIIKSSLDFYNIIAFVSLGEHPEFISVGPVRDKSTYSPDTRQIQKDHIMRGAEQAALRNFYQRLPLVNISDLSMTLHYLLENYIPDYRNVSPEYINFSNEKHTFVPNPDKMQGYTYEVTERIQKLLHIFLNALVTGNTALVYRQKKELLDYFKPLLGNNMETVRNYLNFLNALCCGRLLETQVHPYHTLHLYLSYSAKITQLHDLEQGWLLPYEIARKYCLLVKNHNLSQYSYLVRNIINYISLHLGDELTLTTISQYLEKNPSYVSGQFQKEMGESLTEYIHKERIQAAIRLFNTTDTSVAEAANNVGIHELGYFTRLFKKYIGCTPSQYKKMLK